MAVAPKVGQEVAREEVEELEERGFNLHNLEKAVSSDLGMRGVATTDRGPKAPEVAEPGEKVMVLGLETVHLTLPKEGA